MSEPIASEILALDQTLVPATGHSAPIHFHHFFQLDVLLEGRGYVCLDKKRISCVKGDAYLIPPSVRHGFHFKPGTHFVSFKFHISSKYWSFFRQQFRKVRLTEKLTAMIEDVGARYHSKDALGASYVLSVLNLILIQSFEINHSAGEASELNAFRSKLWSILDRVMENPQGKYSVSSMAKESHLSQAYFSECFQAVLGKSPRRYLLEIRLVSAAQDLIANPQLSIKEVSERASYASVHAFSKGFKKMFAMSPLAYRRSPPKSRIIPDEEACKRPHHDSCRKSEALKRPDSLSESCYWEIFASGNLRKGS